MWEMEGRSTEEIAATLGIKESAVRHTVSRARASLRKVLTTLIVNEETGLTALDALSTTYKKAAEIAQKSSKAALSLILVITAFLGFNSMTGNESPLAPVIAQVDTPAPVASSSAAPSVAPSAKPTATAAEKAAAIAATKKAQQAAIYAKIAALSFVGLNKDGIPTGISITDEAGLLGNARVTKGVSSFGTSGILISNQFITAAAGPNILIDQLITVDGSGTNYSINSLNVGFGGSWRPLEIKATDTSVDRLANGTYLITSTSTITGLVTSDFAIPTGKRGYDLVDAPKSITTRVLLNSGKTAILAQASQVINK
jgi:hypothetical protein